MATRSAKIDQKADLIWAIADKLTGVYKPHEYGDVILPLTVIRRFDCILSDTIFITPVNIQLRDLWMILTTLKRISETI